MTGLELARQYYETFGKEMLENEFSQHLPYLAIGLAGSGSECYGFDDKTSQDHDFEPGFCIFLPGEDLVDRRTAFLLERAYARLPKEFMGFTRSPLSPVGGNRRGVIRMEEFFLAKTGTPDGDLSPEAWFSLPEYALLEATNGEVFRDEAGLFSAIREKLSYLPQDIRLKKLAGHLLLMNQAGQYNYPRCLARGDTGAAQMAAFEFVRSTICCIHLFCGRYVPYYKWYFHSLRSLPRLGDVANDLEYLISSPNTPEGGEKKKDLIETICTRLSSALREDGWICLESDDLESISFAVNDTISDNNLRNLNILYGV